MFEISAFLGLAAITACESSFSPLRPPAIPLAVRSPYLSTWLQVGSDHGNGGYLAGQWPTFWNGATTNWTGIIRVDGDPYVWMGKPDSISNYVNQTAFSYTSTKSVFQMEICDVVGMNITFLSPVTPNDMLRSSLPYSYLDIQVFSLDGNDHDISIYTDISAEWVSGNRSSKAIWDYGVIDDDKVVPKAVITTSNTKPSAKSGHAASNGVSRKAATQQQVQAFDPTGHDVSPLKYDDGSRLAQARSDSEQSSALAYHKLWLNNQMPFSETNEQADWGCLYFATKNDTCLTYRQASDALTRQQFIDDGSLSNTVNTQARVNADTSTVFAFAVDLGQVNAPKNALFQLSLHQHDAVQFLGDHGVQTVPSLWTSYFDSDKDALSFFYNDYETSKALSEELDEQISKDSLADGGEDYLAITSLATRQAFGSIVWTNTPSQPWIFMKEISSNGNMNTVDVIFPFHPLALYLNPNILKYLMDPIYINQESGNWPHKFAIHDIGTHFPNATGHPDGKSEEMPVEECGNMLIMTLAYAQRAHDDAYLAQHYDILRQWNEYLVNDSLVPVNQISTDDFAGSLENQTDLAIKGIVGIEAFAQIANRTGHVEDGVNYTKIAHDYMDQWRDLGTAQDASPPHTTLSYGHNDTHGLLYNIYADRELGLGLVPESVYEMQSNFYGTIFDKYGVPLDTRHNYTKVDWEIFCASVALESTKAKFIESIAQWLQETPTNLAFGDLFDAITGDYPAGGPTFIARPVIGGVFAPLALKSAPTDGYVMPDQAGH